MASGDWNPMLTDYQDPDFNRYVQGVGRDLSNGNWNGAKLFVDNFPVGFGQEGLVNLFSEFGNVLFAKLMPSNRPDKKLTYGFITMDSAVAAEHAISCWNQRTLRSGSVPLKVMPALTDEEKKRRQQSKEMEAEFMSSLRGSFHREDDMISSISGYISSDPHYENRPFAPRKAGILDRMDYQINDGMSRGRGFRPDSMDHGALSLLGRGRLFDFGGRRPQSLAGGDSFRREVNREYSGPGALFGGRGRGSLPMERPFQGMAGQSLGRGLSQHTIQRVEKPRRPPTVNLKTCVYCDTEDSTFRCAACKMFYCSSQCQRKDWPEHREICLDISIHNFKIKTEKAINGQTVLFGQNVSPKKDLDEGSVRSGNSNNFNSNNNFKSNAVKADTGTGKPGKMSKYFNNNGKEHRSGSEERTGGGMKNFKSNNRASSPSNSGPKENRKKFQEKKEGFAKHESDTFKDSSKDKGKKESKVYHNSDSFSKNDGNNNKDKPRNFERKDNDKTNEGKFNQKNQAQEQSQQKPKPKGSDIGQKKDEEDRRRKAPNKTKTDLNKPEETKRSSNSTAQLEASGDASWDLVGQTLEVGAPGECYITHYESPSKFWVILKEEVFDFFRISEDFKQVLDGLPKGTVKKVKAGDLYCIVEDEYWARVKIFTVNKDNTVTAFFPDIGKHEKLNISDLYPLDEAMEIWPAQAICCCLGKVKPKGKNFWAEKSKDRMNKWLGEPFIKELSFKVLEKRGSSHALEISCGGENLADILVSDGLAEMSENNANLPKLCGNVSAGKPKINDEPKRIMAKELKSMASCLEEEDKVNINITTFESPLNFVVHVISPETREALKSIESIINSSDLDQGKPYSPVQGELVLAKFSADNKWYRSEVTKISGKNLKVVFVDYGNQDDLMCKDIRPIEDKDLATFPALSTTMKLWNVPPGSNAEKTVEEMGNLLPDYAMEEGNWSITVKGKKGSTLLVDFVSWTVDEPLSVLLNKKLSVSSPKAKVQAAKSPIKAKVEEKLSKPVTSLSVECLPSDSQTEAAINFVENCSSFYIMLKSNCEKLEKLMQEINSKIDSASPVEKLIAGRYVLAQYEADKVWYRAEVKDPQKCTVLFVDYGNTEVVAASNIRQLPSFASSLPMQAIHCKLDVDSAKLVSVEASFKCLESHVFSVSVVRQQDASDGGKCVVQMMADGDTDVLCYLLEEVKEQVSAEDEKSSTQEKPVTSLSDECLPCDSQTEVAISFVENCSSFYLMLKSNCEKLEKLMQEINSNIDSASPVEKLVAGRYVLAQYEADKVWYRAEVKDPQKCTVLFVDYGNTEVVAALNMRQLPSFASSLPMQAIHCKLDVDSAKLVSVEASFKCLESHVFSVSVVRQRDASDGGKCVVQMMADGGTDVLCYLLEEVKEQTSGGEEKPSAPKSPDSKTVAFAKEEEEEDIGVDSLETDEVSVVSHMESVCDFYIYGSRRQELHDLMQTLQDAAEERPLLQSVHLKTLCIAKFEEDQLWYRAQVSSLVDDETCIVKFIDFGNSQRTLNKDLRQMPAPTKSTPALAIPCCFKEFLPFLGQDQEEILAIQNPAGLAELKAKLCEPIAVSVTVHTHKSGFAIVSLMDTDGNDVLKMFKVQKSSPAVSPPKSKPSTPAVHHVLSDIPVAKMSGSNIEVLCTNMEHLSEFWCQKKDNLESLLEISQVLARDLPSASPVKPVTAKEGRVFGCLFEDTWYRCLVQEVRGDKVFIRYIDWGNCEERPISDLLPLQVSHLTYPLSLMRCKLHGVDIAVDEKSVHNVMELEKYIKLLHEKIETNHLLLDIVDQDGDLYSVSLFIVTDSNARVNIAEDLVETRLAKPVPAVSESLSPQKKTAQGAAEQTQVEAEEEVDDEEDEDDRRLRQLQKEMEELRLRKSKKK